MKIPAKQAERPAKNWVVVFGLPETAGNSYVVPSTPAVLGK
jgi:hypothetical protein